MGKNKGSLITKIISIFPIFYGIAIVGIFYIVNVLEKLTVRGELYTNLFITDLLLVFLLPLVLFINAVVAILLWFKYIKNSDNRGIWILVLNIFYIIFSIVSLLFILFLVFCVGASV